MKNYLIWCSYFDRRRGGEYWIDGLGQTWNSQNLQEAENKLARMQLEDDDGSVYEIHVATSLEMTARDLCEEILGIRSFTVIDHLLQTAFESRKYNQEDLVVLTEIYNEQVLDHRYAICHDQLGQHEKAQELRAFRMNRINRKENNRG
jgi:hypothetical protein